MRCRMRRNAPNMSPTLIDAVTEELADEYKERQTVASRRHDEIAWWLLLRSLLTEYQLFLNGQVRRGFVDDDQRHDLQRLMDQVTPGAAARLAKAKEK